MKRYQIWGDNDNCRAEDPDGEWVRYEDVAWRSRTCLVLDSAVVVLMLGVLIALFFV